jgi:cellulose synthase/poly-beta-1,6-N-acetylglucosamine synthase-like glycosyltransferase
MSEPKNLMLNDRSSKSGGYRLHRPPDPVSQSEPLVTVISAVFDGNDCIVNCLESVLEQDYPHVEHIVLDGGSNDGAVETLRNYDDRVA